jgi:Major Facilitator Superfamily
LWTGDALSSIGSQATTLALPLLVLSLSGSAAQAGLAGVARAVAAPLTVLPAGVLADRVDRRRLLIACALGRAVATASVALALALGRPPLAQLLLVALVDAALASAAFVAERGLLGQIVPDGQLADAVALNEARSAAAGLAGPPVGGALFGVARGLPFVADAASFAVVLAALLGVRSVSPPRAAASLRREAAAGLRRLWEEPFLRASSLLYAAEGVTIAALQLLALLVLRRHGASPAAIGGAFALAGAGGLLGAALAGPARRRLPGGWAVLAEVWVAALLVPALLVLRSAPAVGLLLAAMVVPMTLSTSVVVGRRLALTPEPLRGRVQAGASFLGGSLAWLGPLAVGVLVQYAGEATAVVALAGWALTVAVAATLSAPLRAAGH